MPGLSNSDKVIVFGLLGLIAWEVYRMNNPARQCAPLASLNQGGEMIPNWVKELSFVETGHNYFTPKCGSYGRCQ